MGYRGIYAQVLWETWAFNGGHPTTDVTNAFMAKLFESGGDNECSEEIIRLTFVGLAMAERCAFEVEGDDYSTLYWDWAGVGADVIDSRMKSKNARKVLFSVLTAMTAGNLSLSEEYLRTVTLAAARTIVGWYRENE